MSYEAHVTDTAYCYDGSFAGFLCCVFESYARKEIPAEVCPPEEGQLNFFGTRQIFTDEQYARRVAAGLDRLGREVKDRVTTGFLCTDPGKDLTLLRFVRLCFAQGPRAAQMLGDPDAAAAFALERVVDNEACRLIEFIRFEERDGMLGAVIHPKHRILPLLRGHFCSRLPDESFLIYDAAHGTALLHRDGQVRYLTMERYIPGTDETEPCAQAVLAGYVRDAGRFTIGLPPRGKLSAKRTDEGGVNRCRPFTGNCGGLALIRPCGATFPRGGRLGATHSHTPGSRPGTRSASGADARCRHRSCGLCRPGRTPWRGCHRRRASADAPG